MSKHCAACKVVINDASLDASRRMARLRELTLEAVHDGEIDRDKADAFLLRLARCEARHIDASRQCLADWIDLVDPPREWRALLEHV